MQAQPQLFTSVNFALDWARNHLEFESSELVSQAPWAKTYRLKGASDSAILKLVPPSLVRASTTFPALAQNFPVNLPGVISEDERHGLLLLRNHDGRRLDRRSSDRQRSATLRTYADIQCRAMNMADLLALFPVIDLRALVPDLFGFLESSGSRKGEHQRVGAAFFIGRSMSRNYRRALSERADLLETAVEEAGSLPLTISHGDLRLKNASELRDGTIMLNNWDDAAVGVAGLSLHAFFGKGSTPVGALLGSAHGGAAGDMATERYVLDAYIDTLVAGGYATREALVRSLPGAICAGSLAALIWYRDFADDDRRFRRRIRRIIQARLSDLLDVCDILALRQRGSALRCALDYQENGRARRAEALLRKHLQSDRNDPAGHALFARVLETRGKHREAISMFGEALELNPDDAELHADYGAALLKDLRFDEGIKHLRRAMHLGASGSRLRERLDMASLLRQCEQQADLVDTVPSLPVSTAERESGVLRPELLELGAALFRKHGVLQVENAFDSELIGACSEHFLREYRRYFSAKSHVDALSIGDKRFQVTVTLEGPFNDPGLYGNPLILQLMKKLLGRKFHLGCMVCATSLPGSKDQHLHKDHRALFTADADDPPIYTPPFAITMMVPLVALDAVIGTTTVKKGSHLVSRRESAGMPRQIPIVPVGSCFFMDLRLSHQGLGNKTDSVRPIMNMVYQQPWFADNKNYHKQPPLRIPGREYRKIPEDLRMLFAWATQPGPDVET